MGDGKTRSYEWSKAVIVLPDGRQIVVAATQAPPLTGEQWAKVDEAERRAKR